jgi:hypothetical protein
MVSPLGSFLSAQERSGNILAERQARPQIAAQRDVNLERQKLALGSDQRQRQIQSAQLFGNFLAKVKAMPDPAQRLQTFEMARPELAQFDIEIPTNLTLESVTDEGLAPLEASLAGFAQGPEQLTGAQREFRSLTEGFTPEEVDLARRVKAGIKGRAVGSAAQTIAESGTAESVGDSQATIKEREEFGKLTGSSRAKKIDSGFDQIAGIDKNLRNIDRAIAALQAGAGTGAIESRFFPSIKAASVELDNIQGELALDVVGATTFGALSKGELDLAREVALPTKLEKDDLISFLNRKKEAQQKLRSYYDEQIQFLDQGGTIAGFLRMKEGQIQQPQQDFDLEYDPATGTFR